MNVDLGASNSLMIHPPGKVPPDADYTSTAIVYGTHPTMTTPPQPLFTYSTTPARRGYPGLDRATSTSRARPTSPGSGTRRTNTFQRFYNGTTPDMLADNVQNAAANVVVQYVQISYGPWLENSEGGLEVQADLYPNASGTAVIYRNGMAIPATWHRVHARVAHAVRQRVRRADPVAAGPDLGGAGAQHHHGHDDAVGGLRRSRGPGSSYGSGLRATSASNRQSAAAANTPGCALASASSNTPAAAPLTHQVEALALGHLEAGPLELGHQLARAVLDLVVVVHRRVRSQPPQRARSACRGRTSRPGASTRNASRTTASPSASLTCSMDWPL